MDENAALKENLRGFLIDAPEQLANHVETLRYAEQLRNVASQLDHHKRFTVAIAGQMKTAKSTLVNALLGQHLAIVGANETTATLNCFDYGENEECRSFQVRWRDPDRADSVLTIEDIQGFIGKGDDIHAVKSLHFRTNAEFLRSVRLVDTPGTRSTEDAHQRAADDYFSDGSKSETTQTTIEASEKADAIIYTMPNSARGDDKNFLDDFGDTTRPIGGRAYNCIAVIQKWEALGTDSSVRLFDDNPISRVQGRAERFKEQLGGHFSEIIPVSGALWLASQRTPLSVWSDVLRLVKETPEPELEVLMKKDTRFIDRDRLSVLTIDQRQSIMQSLAESIGGDQHANVGSANWTVLRFAVWRALRLGLTDATTLVQDLAEQSNVGQLKDTLEKRFFSISDLISAGSILRKALVPAESALHSLSVSIEQMSHRRKDGYDLCFKLGQLDTNDNVCRDESRSMLWTLLDNEQGLENQKKATCISLEGQMRHLKRQFDLIARDVELLQDLEPHVLILNSDEVRILRHLLGQYGVLPHERLDLEPGTDVSICHKKAMALRNQWSARQFGPLRRLSEHVTERLDVLLDEFDNHKEGNDFTAT